MSEQTVSLVTIVALVLLAVLAWAVSLVWILRDVRRRGLSRFEQAAWFALAALVPFLGAIGYGVSRVLGRIFSVAPESLEEERHETTLIQHAPAEDRHQSTIFIAPPPSEALPAPTRMPPPPVKVYWLSVLEGPAQGQNYPVQSLPARIGRGPQAAVALDEDLAVSRQHAELYEHNGVVHLRDLQSTHGTWVNGVRIQDQPLSRGDHIRTGFTVLAFLGTGEE